MASKVKPFRQRGRVKLALEDFERLRHICTLSDLQIQAAENTYQQAVVEANAPRRLEMHRLAETYREAGLDVNVDYGFEASTCELVPKETKP